VPATCISPRLAYLGYSVFTIWVKWPPKLTGNSLGVTFFPCSLASLPNIRSHCYTTSFQNLSTTACIKRSSSLARRPTAHSGPLLTSKLTIWLLLADLAMSHGYFPRSGPRSSTHVSTKSSPVKTSPPKGYKDAPIYQFTGIPDLQKRVQSLDDELAADRTTEQYLVF
jgi:hypothetical protein